MTVVETLTTALEIMRRQGWVRHVFVSPEGHCALGALRDAQPDGVRDLSLENLKRLRLLGGGFVSSAFVDSSRVYPHYNNFYTEAIDFLYEALPSQIQDTCHYEGFDEPTRRRCVVARFNNIQVSFTEIEKWFNRAIDLAQAKEMWKELEAAPAVAEGKGLKEGDVVCSLK